MDQGVIRSLKAYYKAVAMQRLFVAINNGKDLPGFFYFRRNENAQPCMARSENLHYH